MTWSITEIKVSNDPQEGNVVVASFEVTDGTSTVASDTRINETEPEDFTPLDEVTQEQCVVWVKEALGEDQVAVYEAMVAQKTNAVEPQLVPLPWENN